MFCHRKCVSLYSFFLNKHDIKLSLLTIGSYPVVKLHFLEQCLSQHIKQKLYVPICAWKVELQRGTFKLYCTAVQNRMKFKTIQSVGKT